jgi:hypothetical protein
MGRALMRGRKRVDTLPKEEPSFRKVLEVESESIKAKGRRVSIGTKNLNIDMKGSKSGL